MTIRLGTAAALALACALAARSAAAHDFWIAPSTFRPAAGEPVELRLAVGERCEGEAVPRRPDRIESFRLHAGGSVTDVGGEAGRDPAGITSVPRHGVALVTYRSRHARVELDAASFAAHVRDEHETGVAPAPGRPAREAYSRCCKSLLVCGGSPAAMPPPLGWPLELQLMGASTDWRPGAPLRVQVLAAGRPLADRTVSAVSCAGAEPPTTAVTGGDGVATLLLPHEGPWLLKHVAIRRAPPEVASAMDVEWESHWATLTLQLASP